MTDFKELREALDVVEASPEFVPGQWAIEPEMFEPDCLCDEDIAYIAAANPATIRVLLAELDAARRDAERLRKDGEKWREWQEAQRLVEEEMPEGYRVILDMSPGDWSLRAEDPDGNALRIEDWESTEHFIRDAVDLAKEPAAMKEQQ